MSTIRPGRQSALVVVDVQVGVMDVSWDAPRVIDKVARAVDRARQAGVPVVWVQHADDDMPRGSADWQLVPALVPADGEPRVFKAYPSSFADTDLEDILGRLGTSHVVLAGAQTNWCIRATAYAALERGYDLTLLQDAHTTASIALRDGSTVPASAMVTDLNNTMTWLRYPGRQAAIAAVEELDFASVTGNG